MYADRKKIPLDRVQVTLAHEKQKGEDDAVFDNVDVKLKLEGAELTADQKKRLMEIAGKCPVKKTITSGTLKVNTTLETDRIVLVLDRCYDIHNIQAVLRTSECLGIQNVWVVLPVEIKGRKVKVGNNITQGKHIFLSIRTFNTSQYVCEALNYSDVIRECLDALVAEGRVIWATSLDLVSVSLDSITPQDIPQKLALIIELCSSSNSSLGQYSAHYTLSFKQPVPELPSGDDVTAGLSLLTRLRILETSPADTRDTPVKTKAKTHSLSYPTPEAKTPAKDASRPKPQHDMELVLRPDSSPTTQHTDSTSTPPTPTTMETNSLHSPKSRRAAAVPPLVLKSSSKEPELEKPKTRTPRSQRSELVMSPREKTSPTETQMVITGPTETPPKTGRGDSIVTKRATTPRSKQEAMIAETAVTLLSQAVTRPPVLENTPTYAESTRRNYTRSGTSKKLIVPARRKAPAETKYATVGGKPKNSGNRRSWNGRIPPTSPVVCRGPLDYGNDFYKDCECCGKEKIKDDSHQLSSSGTACGAGSGDEQKEGLGSGGVWLAEVEPRVQRRNTSTYTGRRKVDKINSKASSGYSQKLRARRTKSSPIAKATLVGYRLASFPLMYQDDYAIEFPFIDTVPTVSMAEGYLVPDFMEDDANSEALTESGGMSTADAAQSIGADSEQYGWGIGAGSVGDNQLTTGTPFASRSITETGRTLGAAVGTESTACDYTWDSKREEDGSDERSFIAGSESFAFTSSATTSMTPVVTSLSRKRKREDKRSPTTDPPSLKETKLRPTFVSAIAITPLSAPAAESLSPEPAIAAVIPATATSATESSGNDALTAPTTGTSDTADEIVSDPISSVASIGTPAVQQTSQTKLPRSSSPLAPGVLIKLPLAGSFEATPLRRVPSPRYLLETIPEKEKEKDTFVPLPTITIPMPMSMPTARPCVNTTHTTATTTTTTETARPTPLTLINATTTETATTNVVSPAPVTDIATSSACTAENTIPGADFEAADYEPMPITILTPVSVTTTETIVITPVATSDVTPSVSAPIYTVLTSSLSTTNRMEFLPNMSLSSGAIPIIPSSNLYLPASTEQLVHTPAQPILSTTTSQPISPAITTTPTETNKTSFIPTNLGDPKESRQALETPYAIAIKLEASLIQLPTTTSTLTPGFLRTTDDVPTPDASQSFQITARPRGVSTPETATTATSLIEPDEAKDKTKTVPTTPNAEIEAPVPAADLQRSNPAMPDIRLGAQNEEEETDYEDYDRKESLMTKAKKEKREKHKSKSKDKIREKEKDRENKDNKEAKDRERKKEKDREKEREKVKEKDNRDKKKDSAEKEKEQREREKERERERISRLRKKKHYSLEVHNTRAGELLKISNPPIKRKGERDKSRHHQHHQHHHEREKEKEQKEKDREKGRNEKA